MAFYSKYSHLLLLGCFKKLWGPPSTQSRNQYQYAKWVQNTLTICFCIFFNLDDCSGQVCIIVAFQVLANWDLTRALDSDLHFE